MDKFLDIIQEVTYDLVGYVFPGIIALGIILFSFDGELTSPVYKFVTSIDSESTRSLSSYKSVLDYITSINLFVIVIISYILGHIIIFIGLPIRYIIKLLIGNEYTDKTSDCNKNNSFIANIKIILKNNIKKLLGSKSNSDYITYLYNTILDLYENDIVIKKIIDNGKKDEKILINYLDTLASTSSRFEKHTNLIQKYIYKKDLYSSLSVIFSLLLFNSICLIVFDFTNAIIYIVLVVLLHFIVSNFMTEHNRHVALLKKEKYMYLIYRTDKNESM